MSKLGKSAGDIFSNKPEQYDKPPLKAVISREKELENAEDQPARQGRGRPVEHRETWSKITVVLLDNQIHWLDQLTSTIRLKTKAAVSRAELIRGVLGAIEESGLDLSELGHEKEIKDFILEKLGK